MSDASYMDGEPGPVMLRAESPDDLAVISSLVQDAVLSTADIGYEQRRRQLALLVNRFRWEDVENAEREGRPYERVRAVLAISDALAVKTDGIDRSEGDVVLSLLSLRWEPGEDGTGRLLLDFAGDGCLAVEAECLSVDLRDVTRPYAAPSGQRPSHPDA